MEKPERLFAFGRVSPLKFGWPLRSSAGEPPDSRQIEEVAGRLARPVFFVDAEGYECELIGAAASPGGRIAYVESRAKDIGFNQHGANQRHIDITIRVHLVDPAGSSKSAEIESYNPFFGCDVRFFEWIEETAVLIYREKHWTVACQLEDVRPPRFLKIEDDWIINGDILGYIGYKQEVVRRLTFPKLEVLEPISLVEAKRVGLFPIT